MELELELELVSVDTSNSWKGVDTETTLKLIRFHIAFQLFLHWYPRYMLRQKRQYTRSRMKDKYPVLSAHTPHIAILSNLVLAILAQKLTIIRVHHAVTTPSTREAAAAGVRPSNTAKPAAIASES